VNNLENPRLGKYLNNSQVMKKILQRNRFRDKPGLLSHGQSERAKCFASTVFCAIYLGTVQCSFGTFQEERMRKELII